MSSYSIFSYSFLLFLLPAASLAVGSTTQFINNLRREWNNNPHPEQATGSCSRLNSTLQHQNLNHLLPFHGVRSLHSFHSPVHPPFHFQCSIKQRLLLLQDQVCPQSPLTSANFTILPWLTECVFSHHFPHSTIPSPNFSTQIPHLFL